MSGTREPNWLLEDTRRSTAEGRARARDRCAGRNATVADRLVSTRRHWQRVFIRDRREGHQGRAVAAMSRKLTKEQKAAALAKWAAYLQRIHRIRQGLEEPEPLRVFRYTFKGTTEDAG